jgi:hypothetical protein
MNVFQTHSRIVADYATYIRSFLKIADPQIRDVVEGELSKGKLWPEPLLQFNPSFEMYGSLDKLAQTGMFIPIFATSSRATLSIATRSTPSSWVPLARISSSHRAQARVNR